MPAPARLLVGESLWMATVAALAPYAEARVEAGVYWYGIRNLEAAAACSVGIPRQVNRRANFTVAADDLAALTRVMSEPLVVIAQLHTHPGKDTRHSSWDDDLTVSRKILSIVLPEYGRDPKLEEAGIHECLDGGWLRLERREVADRIVLIPTLSDGRRER
jgi:hypothetical protein